MFVMPKQAVHPGARRATRCTQFCAGL